MPRSSNHPAHGVSESTIEGIHVKQLAVSLSALLLVGAVASPAVAGHDRVPSERVEKYVHDLNEVADNDPLGSPEGTAKLVALPNGKVEVTIEATGLAPNLPHAQHLHVPVEDGTGDFVRGTCPGEDADTNEDDLVDINGNGEYDFAFGPSSLTDTLPLEATIPAVCGGPNG